MRSSYTKLTSKLSIVALVLFSALVHIAILDLLYGAFADNTEEPSAQKSITLSLKVQPKPANKPKPSTEPQPVLSETPPVKKSDQSILDPQLLIKSANQKDKTSSNNQDNKEQASLEYGAKQASEKRKEAKDNSTIKTHVITSKSNFIIKTEEKNYSESLGIDKDNKSNNSDGKLEKADNQLKSDVDEILEIPKKLLGNLGNMTQLSELELGESFVEQPFSEHKSKEFKLVNGYLKRIAEQVYVFYSKNNNLKSDDTGTIHLKLDPAGYLVSRKLIRSSRNELMDKRAIKAIDSVVQYRLHPNPEINKKYFSELLFYYGGRKAEYELMPYEKTNLVISE